MGTRKAVALVALWLARLCALLLILLWGGFFVEHLREWFLRSDGRLPPVWVWVGQFLHLLMLLGLALVAFRPSLGAISTILATALFFGLMSYHDGFKGFPYLALVNLPPAALALVYAALKAQPDSNGAAASKGYLRRQR